MNTPIYNVIRKYADSGILPFHMPGHKLGRGLLAEFLSAPAALDITEIPGMDYLHQPTGIIKEAQDLAAKAFGAKNTYFLVNGSTCGIYAMIRTICRPGESLLVARDCHKSVIYGMMLAGVDPVYIMPEYDSSLCISTGITPEKLDRLLDANRNVAGVLITRPNYYGICSDIKSVAAIVHSYGKVLAVDEAHGAHLRFGNRLPVCAMDAGADICVQSAHKTLPALTQGAYLHVGSKAIDIERLQYFLKLNQTSSPSYLIMASLDMAREIMQENGCKLLDDLIDVIESNKASVSDKAICFAGGFSGRGFETDKTRITANVGRLGITGYMAEKMLREMCNIQVEMSDLSNIVCIATIADTEETIGQLFSGFGELVKIYDGNQPLEAAKIGLGCDIRNTCKITDFEAVMQAGSEWTRLGNSVGRISKDIIAPYPPGIPVLCPGELISREAVEFLYSVVKAGGKINGINENLEINVV